MTPARLFWSTSGKIDVIELNNQLLSVVSMTFSLSFKAFESTRGAEMIGLLIGCDSSFQRLSLCFCSTLRQRADPVYSPPLQISGLCWRLKVYPVSLLYRSVQSCATGDKLIILYFFIGWKWGGPWELPVCLPGTVCWSPRNIKVYTLFFFSQS